ncbi:NAD(P)/FAD-dependent oxidoreductase [Streptosporangium sp. NPDC023615]|uniref:NAD(P)/FAD-dependent oxidoreductase n=1 Tax=Streptosporangium sp. NPDC023615 TaxID=3154794 RepID=UPI003434013F
MAPDVVVIGGGPAGSISSALLARAGARVRLLERDSFPRYHVGESISSSCRAIIDLVGVREKIEARGYTVKEGLLLRWGAERDWTINWPDLFGDKVRSWQVDRADFDDVLLKHAAEQGVEVVHGAHVKKVRFDEGRAVGVDWVLDGQARRSTADYVVDASGRAGVLSAQHFRDRTQLDVFRNVAIWGYYQGGGLLPRTPRGGINVISSPHGWYWVIPLSGDVYSVGFVTHQDNFLARRPEFPTSNEMFLALVAESETVSELISGGRFKGKARIEQDFSYSAASFCGPGYFLAGDSACFLDPLLSTGVHLAMYSGTLAAASILSAHAGEVTESEALGFYESLYRNAYGRMFSMVAGFYEQYRGKAEYFWLAQRLARGQYPKLMRKRGVEVAPDSAFASITSGLTDLDDATRSGGATPLDAMVLATELTARDAVAAETPEPDLGVRQDPDAAGLYLVTEPRLGIGRAAEPATPR